MATILWPTSPAGPDDSTTGGLPAPDPVESKVRHMDSLRRFVGDLLGTRAAELTDRDWAQLWSAAQGCSSEAEAISRVVVEAYRIGQQSETPIAPAPSMRHPAQPQDAVRAPDPLDDFIQAVAVEVPAGDADVVPWPLGDGPGPGGTEVASPPAPVRPSTTHRRRRSGGQHRRGRSPRSTRGALAVAPASAIPAEPVRSRKVGELDTKRRERLLTAASWVRNIGVIILLFVAWQLWGTSITQHHEQAVLQSQFAAKVPHVVAKPPPGFTLVPAATRLVDPPQGTVMAQLQIPKINLSEYVVSGTDADDLDKGPGHYLGTAMPGQAGNVAIAGHRTTHGAPFNRLAELAVGDPIYLTTLTGQRLTYIVSATPVPVSPSDVTVLNNFGDDRLTLTTCNPEYSARQRLIVVAAYQAPGAPKPMPIAQGGGTPYKLAPTPTSGWEMKLLPLVALELAGLAFLGLAYRKLSRAYGRDGRWLILVPVWIALLYALFETLTNFLPAAV